MIGWHIQYRICMCIYVHMYVSHMYHCMSALQILQIQIKAATFRHYQDYYRGNGQGKNSSKCDSLKNIKTHYRCNNRTIFTVSSMAKNVSLAWISILRCKWDNIGLNMWLMNDRGAVSIASPLNWWIPVCRSLTLLHNVKRWWHQSCTGID